jgi:hypothetical protein
MGPNWAFFRFILFTNPPQRAPDTQIAPLRYPPRPKLPRNPILEVPTYDPGGHSCIRVNILGNQVLSVGGQIPIDHRKIGC